VTVYKLRVFYSFETETRIIRGKTCILHSGMDYKRKTQNKVSFTIK